MVVFFMCNKPMLVEAAYLGLDESDSVAWMTAPEYELQ